MHPDLRVCPFHQHYCGNIGQIFTQELSLPFHSFFFFFSIFWRAGRWLLGCLLISLKGYYKLESGELEPTPTLGSPTREKRSHQKHQSRLLSFAEETGPRSRE